MEKVSFLGERTLLNILSAWTHSSLFSINAKSYKIETTELNISKKTQVLFLVQSGTCWLFSGKSVWRALHPYIEGWHPLLRWSVVEWRKYVLEPKGLDWNQNLSLSSASPFVGWPWESVLTFLDLFSSLYKIHYCHTEVAYAVECVLCPALTKAKGFQGLMRENISSIWSSAAVWLIDLCQFTVVGWLRIFVVFLYAGSPGPLLSMVTGVLSRPLYPSVFINQTIQTRLDPRRPCMDGGGGRRVNVPSPRMFTAEGSHDLCAELCFSALSHLISCFIFKGGNLILGPLWNIQGTLAMFRTALSYNLMRPLMCLCVCFGPDPRLCPVSYPQWGWRVGRVNVYLGGPHLSWTLLLCWLRLKYGSPFLIG